jgi:hypothetical protein
VSRNIVFAINSFFSALNSKINDLTLTSRLAASTPNAIALTKRDLDIHIDPGKYRTKTARLRQLKLTSTFLSIIDN